MPKTVILTREEFHKIYEQGEEAIYAFVLSLMRRIEVLEQRLGLNSTNSSKPPSSDGLAKPKPKPKSSRERTGKQNGGQKGHAGTTLLPKENPDIIIIHEPERCSCCGHDLSTETGTVIHKHQVADLPEIDLQYTEHRMVEKECPHCHQKNQGELPKGIDDAAVQYGPRVLAFFVYLSVAQFMSYERIVETCEAMFGFAPSEGTVHKALETCYEELAPFEEEVKEKLKDAEVLHCDETGIRMEGKTGWFHVASDEDLTYYHVDEKRGKDAIDRIGLLPVYDGTVIHDCLPSYFQYDVSHGLCNAHILRELRYIWEEMGQSWALEMSDLLKEGLLEKEERGIPNTERYAEYERRYMEILSRGKKQQPPPVPKPEGQRGREAKSKSLNLIERLERHRESVLAYLRKEEVPFTNNRAEQDIRMAKVKMKVSGGFRTKKGACIFARIRAAISTMQKQGRKIFAALQSIFRGIPLNLSRAE
jgi:transposase